MWLHFQLPGNTKVAQGVEIIPHGRPGTCLTCSILIEFEIQSKFGVLWFKMCSTDHNKILHMLQ